MSLSDCGPLEKAADLTKELGAGIGRVYSINENTWGGGAYTMRGGLYTQNSIQNISGAAVGEGFAAGQISISARVNVSFVINSISSSAATMRK